MLPIERKRENGFGRRVSRNNNNTLNYMTYRFLITAALLGLGTTAALACTNLIVGKKASADGSVFVTYNADDYGAYGSLLHFAAGTHAKGTMRDVVDWESGVYHGKIAEAARTYNVVGNMNENQVTIGETTFGGREELVDTTAVIDYGSLEYITLQRARTAREAILIMASLVKEYGYGSEGESFSVADPNEAWIMEIVGKGPGNRGALWVAVRIPDDCICAHANQSRIRQFPLNDKKNCLYAPDVISYARKKGYFKGKDKDFSFQAAYAPADFEALRFCEARVWSFFNKFVPGMDKYLAYAKGTDVKAEPMPLYVKPARQLTLQDVQGAMRDHYEGTPFELTKDIGAGPYDAPYRPTPLVFTVDSVKYFNERPISTQQTSFTIVCQMRGFLPNAVGGIEWFGNDDANMIAYVPVYTCSTSVPVCFQRTSTSDELTFSWKSAFWLCNWVSNMIYPRYCNMIGDLRTAQQELEEGYFKEVAANDAAFAARFATDSAATVAALTAYTEKASGRMMERWMKLGEYLVVKHNDQTIRKEKDGHFLRTATGRGVPPTRTGFPSKYAHKYVELTGDRYKVPVSH
jgi:dipeptidase